MQKLQDLLQRPTGVYQKPINVYIAGVCPRGWSSFISPRSGQTVNCLRITVADNSACVRSMCYNMKYAEHLVEGNSIQIKNPLYQNGVVKILAVDSAVYRCAPVCVPADIMERAKLLLIEPIHPIISIEQAKHAAVKSKVSVRGQIVTDGETREIDLNGGPTKVRDLIVSDETAHIGVTLWREATSIAVGTGDMVKFKDVGLSFSKYNDAVFLSVNASCEMEVVSKFGGDNLQASLHGLSNLEDASTSVSIKIGEEYKDMIITKSNLMSALRLVLPNIQMTVQDILPLLPLNCEIGVVGSLIVAIVFQMPQIPSPAIVVQEVLPEGDDVVSVENVNSQDDRELKRELSKVDGSRRCKKPKTK